MQLEKNADFRRMDYSLKRMEYKSRRMNGFFRLTKFSRENRLILKQKGKKTINKQNTILFSFLLLQ